MQLRGISSEINHAVKQKVKRLKIVYVFIKIYHGNNIAFGDLVGAL